MNGTTTTEQPSRKTAVLDRHGYLFGQKIAASLSPQFHKTIFDELGRQWEQLRLDSADIASFLNLLQDPKCFGASVTMPNKVAIMEHLDEVSEECREIGACNTIYFRDEEEEKKEEEDTAISLPNPEPTPHRRRRRKLHGANTDVIGVRESFYQNISDPDRIFHDRPAMVIGGGGAARSAVYALHKWMRATSIYLVNRDAAEVDAVVRDCRARGYGDRLLHVETVDQALTLEPPGAVVACVPDFPPVTDDEKRARDVVETFLRMPRKGAVLEMCYNPSPHTALGALAEREGWLVILGTEAMIWQGFEQSKLWTGLEWKDLPVAKCKEVIAGKVSQRL